MNRIATMAIAATAVAGIAGGTFAATTGAGDAGGPAGDASATTGGTRTPDGPVAAFYLDGRTIVDGDRKVPVAGLTIDNVRSLERVSGGWFVVTATSPQEPAFRGTYVAADGTTTDIGDFFGLWDVDDQGDRVVARFDDTYQVRDVTTGEVTEEVTVGADVAPSGSAAFAGADVVSAWIEEGKHPRTRLFRTDLGTGTEHEVTQDLFSSTVSPDGRWLLGERYRIQETSGELCLGGGPVDDFAEQGWGTCDWRTNGLKPQFSPDGTRLLVVPYETEGFGPTQYGVLDSTNGRVTQEIDLPEWASDAAWGDDETVFLHGYPDADLTGGVVYRCTLDGDCRREVTSTRPIVLGTQAG